MVLVSLARSWMVKRDRGDKEGGNEPDLRDDVLVPLRAVGTVGVPTHHVARARRLPDVGQVKHAEALPRVHDPERVAVPHDAARVDRHRRVVGRARGPDQQHVAVRVGGAVDKGDAHAGGVGLLGVPADGPAVEALVRARVKGVGRRRDALRVPLLGALVVEARGPDLVALAVGGEGVVAVVEDGRHRDLLAQVGEDGRERGDVAVVGRLGELEVGPVALLVRARAVGRGAGRKDGAGAGHEGQQAGGEPHCG